jgi:hypothetical protein
MNKITVDKMNESFIRANNRSINILYRICSLGRRFYSPEHGMIIQDKIKKEKKKNIISYENNSTSSDTKILDMLNFNIKTAGKSIERAVHLQIHELERLNYEHDLNVLRLADKLSYVQKNIGLYNKGVESRNKSIASELIDMPLDKVIELVITLTNVQGTNLKLETELSILLSHLVFRNSLKADLFSRIIMKFQLYNLKKIHNKLMNDPSGFILGWDNDNGRSRIVCGLALSARYKMLKDYDNAKLLLQSEFANVWMNTLINNIGILKGNDLKNLINIIDGLIEYGYLVACVIKINNGFFIYSFWENHPDDGIIKDWLENEIQKDLNGTTLNKYQKFIIQLYTNPCISTTEKWKMKTLNISKKLRLSILNSDQVNKDKFIAFTELLLNEMEEEMDNDIERKDYFNKIQTQFNELKSNIHNANDIEICINETIVKTL